MIFKRRSFLSLAGYTFLFSNFPSFVWSKIKKHKYLILIELQGANDGLNTVIPYNQRFYYKLRPTIAIPKKDVLTINKENGLHFNLKSVMSLFETGEVKIIQNLGYPNPILSHFRSIDIWETGGDGKKQNRNGWLVSSLERYSKNQNIDAKGMFLDNSNTIFRGGFEGYLGPSSIGLEPEQIEVRDTLVPVDTRKNFGLLNQLIETRKKNQNVLNKFITKLKNNKSIYDFKGGQLGSQLSNVCNLIASGINIPVFKTAIGSFDTHNNQLGTHNRLLKDLDLAIGDTAKALKQLGIWNDTIIMTYSEFGRRASENGSRGTDHGMAAPHFIIGGSVKGGIIGEYQELSNLWNNNINFKIDYRSLYEFILREHFNINDNPFSNYRSKIII